VPLMPVPVLVLVQTKTEVQDCAITRRPRLFGDIN